MKHYKIRQSITDRSNISVDLYLKDISKYKLLTEEEERYLVRQKEEGNEKAKNRLIEANLRFVVSIAKQYQGKGLDLEDLISAGNMGLMLAVEKYNLDFHCRLVSYAVWWIRDYILKELMVNGGIIKVPVGKNLLINKLNKISNEFEQEFQRPPTYEELGERLDLSEKDIKNILDSRVLKVNNSISDSDGNEESIFENLAVPDETDEDLQNEHKSSDIINILKSILNETEYKVITESFGLQCTERDIDDIADDCGITKERVRQIKDKAIIKIRKSSLITKLQNYL